jgi:hypothetical protein
MAGVFRTGYQAIADAIWSLVAVGSRTVTVTTNNDKTGYALTSLTGLVRIQSNNINLGPSDLSKPYTLPIAVAAGKAFVVNKGHSADATAQATNGAAFVRLSHSTTQVTATRELAAGSVTVEFDVVEFL